MKCRSVNSRLNPTMFKKTQFKFREGGKNLGIYEDT
jgi:hypothetical protein